MSFDPKYLLGLEAAARAKSPKLLYVPVTGQKSAKLLFGALERHLVTLGFTFKDIDADKNNDSCIKSRQGFKPMMGKRGVHFTLRLFNRGDGTVSFFVHVQ